MTRPMTSIYTRPTMPELNSPKPNLDLGRNSKQAPGSEVSGSSDPSEASGIRPVFQFHNEREPRSPAWS
ncbi:hypothetical protein CMEL01_11516 [Colletotrichum melonis]|uniref:Uncharacterized protein n=1 Tax=Colletotrichum melonis TaxID=1209925 RepID=A0AAI9Y139_9PEZI|nr:hypothetical protein CMEL01_11516 [Colletotrichum melonis]